VHDELDERLELHDDDGEEELEHDSEQLEELHGELDDELDLLQLEDELVLQLLLEL
jgi:hypothetical protein